MQELDDFRVEVREWLEDNCPPSQRRPISPEEQYWGGRRGTFASEDARLWYQRMHDRRWLAPEWPEAYGGAGLGPRESRVIREELKRIHARAPLYGLGLWLLGPALLEFGSEEQKRRHLPDILDAKIRWAQGYSEPGAGSDLASLQCRAEDRGDHFLVNGSKIWTTAADRCDWIFCLVRTDPEAGKHAGISFLLIDMDDPGVSTTPIELISGESEFCQTFFDNVAVPRDNLVGELNAGWGVAKALLVHERKFMAELGSDSPRRAVDPAVAARQYLEFVDGRIADASLRARLADYTMRMQAIGLTHLRGFEEAAAGMQGNVPLVMKYLGTESEKTKSELLLAILGSSGLGWEGAPFSAEEIDTARLWAMSKAMTIAGGTTEIQLNLIARRLLGLPQGGH